MGKIKFLIHWLRSSAVYWAGSRKYGCVTQIRDRDEIQTMHMLKKTIGVSGARTLTKAPKGVGGEKGTSEGTVGKKKNQILVL